MKDWKEMWRHFKVFSPSWERILEKKKASLKLLSPTVYKWHFNTLIGSDLIGSDLYYVITTMWAIQRQRHWLCFLLLVAKNKVVSLPLGVSCGGHLQLFCWIGKWIFRHTVMMGFNRLTAWTNIGVHFSGKMK